MKLATLKTGGRDGTLVVVSRDLVTCQAVPKIAPTLQAALDDWDKAAPQLCKVYERLNAGTADKAESFIEEECHSPLPRAYQWCDGSAYLNHVELVRKARNARRCRPQLLYRSADVPGRIGDSFAGAGARTIAVRSDECAWHRLRGRGRGHHRRRADGRHSRPQPRRAMSSLVHAGQRRLAAQLDPERTGERVWLLPVQAGQRLFAGGGHARRAGRCLGRLQAAPADPGDPPTTAPSAARTRART